MIHSYQEDLEMDMCYDGTLVMPKNYVLMNEEEMTYLEGGEYLGTMSSANCNIIAALCSIGAAALTVGGAVVTLIATLVGTPIT